MISWIKKCIGEPAVGARRLALIGLACCLACGLMACRGDGSDADTDTAAGMSSDGGTATISTAANDTTADETAAAETTSDASLATTADATATDTMAETAIDTEVGTEVETMKDTDGGADTVVEPETEPETEIETETETETESEPETESETEIETEPETETESETETETEPETETSAPAEVALTVKWRKGYIGSSTNAQGHANAVDASDKTHAFTDVIQLGKKGTKITFTDTENGVVSPGIYVISSWKRNGDSWVIDLDRTNIPGGMDLVVSVTDGATVYTYISKYDDECVRFCFPAGSMSNRPTIYMSETDEPGTAEDFLTDAERLELWVREDSERAFYDILQGKTFTVIGDSYLAGNGLDKKLVWPALLAKKYGMEYNNYGVNGSTLSNYVTTNSPMVDRYTSMADNDPDIIVIEGGRNDYNKAVPLGEDGSMDTTTMKGAARYLITRVRERYPNATIICLTVWEVGGKPNALGNYCSDYGTALLEVCRDMGVPCINAMDQEATGVYMTDPDFRTQYCMKPTDISHLNGDGMKLVFPVFEKYIATYLAEQTA